MLGLSSVTLGVESELLWGRFEVIRGRFAVHLGQLGAAVGLNWGRAGVDSGSSWSRSGVHLGPIRGAPFSGNIVSPVSPTLSTPSLQAAPMPPRNSRTVHLSFQACREAKPHCSSQFFKRWLLILGPVEPHRVSAV